MSTVSGHTRCGVRMTLQALELSDEPRDVEAEIRKAIEECDQFNNLDCRFSQFEKGGDWICLKCKKVIKP